MNKKPYHLLTFDGPVVTIEGMHFKGSACEAAGKVFKKALGIASAGRKKACYYESQSFVQPAHLKVQNGG